MKTTICISIAEKALLTAAWKRWDICLSSPDELPEEMREFLALVQLGNIPLNLSPDGPNWMAAGG